MSKNVNIADLINYISVDGSGNVVLTTGGQVATQSYVTTAVSNLVNAAPSTLDTLNELAAALGNDANFATTVTNSIATKLPLSGGTLTGALTGTSATFSGNMGVGGNTTEIAGFTSLTISNSSSGSFLDLNNNGVNNLRFLSLSSVDQRIQAQGNLRFDTAGTKRFEILSTGAATFSANVGIRNSNPYSPLTVTGAGISWGETVTYYPASNGYITLAFRLEGTDTTTGTWAIGKQSTIESGGVQYLQIAKNGLTGSTLHRPDAVQVFDPANGNAYFGFNVGIGTTSPFNFGSIHRTLDVRGSSTSSIGALFVGNSNRTSVLGFYINPAAGGTVGTSSNHFLQLVTNDVERIRIGTNGNVGIANDNPLSRLHIGPEGSVGGNTPVIVMSSAAGTKPSMLITEYTARSGAFGYDNNNFLTLATETGVTAGIKLKVGSSFGGGLLNTGTDAIIINTSGQVQRPNQPAFLAYSTGFTVTGGGWYNVSNAITTESYDVTSNYSGGRFTAPVAGRYLFYAGGWTSINSNGERYAWCARVNDGGLFYIVGGNYCLTDSPLAGYSIVYNLNAGDYVDLLVFSAVSGTWGGGSHSVWWGGYLL